MRSECADVFRQFVETHPNSKFIRLAKEVTSHIATNLPQVQGNRRLDRPLPALRSSESVVVQHSVRVEHGDDVVRGPPWRNARACPLRCDEHPQHLLRIEHPPRPRQHPLRSQHLRHSSKRQPCRTKSPGFFDHGLLFLIRF